MTEEHTEPVAEDDYLHRRFREALERKKSVKHANNGPHDAQEKAQGQQNTTVKRQFRRKSGG